jgi:hypothetical protein
MWSRVGVERMLNFIHYILQNKVVCGNHKPRWQTLNKNKLTPSFKELNEKFFQLLGGVGRRKKKKTKQPRYACVVPHPLRCLPLTFGLSIFSAFEFEQEVFLAMEIHRMLSTCT